VQFVNIFKFLSHQSNKSKYCFSNSLYETWWRIKSLYEQNDSPREFFKNEIILDLNSFSNSLYTGRWVLRTWDNCNDQLMFHSKSLFDFYNTKKKLYVCIRLMLYKNCIYTLMSDTHSQKKKRWWEYNRFL